MKVSFCSNLPTLGCITSFFLINVLIASCQPHTSVKKGEADTLQVSKPDSSQTKPASFIGKKVDAATIFAKPQIPILCYHQIRDWRATDSKKAKDYIVPVQIFKDQLKMLADSGFHTISPDELVNYLAYRGSLPSRPILLTFDDTDLPQYTIAKPEMEKYGFKGTFFIMTVSLGRPNYMTREQVKELAMAGNTIGSHTWDHKNVKKYTTEDWVIQVDRPTRQLEAITGKPIKYFAFPFGLWNREAIPQLKERGFMAAFQLSTKRDELEPLFTIRRIIVPGEWSPNTLSKYMKHSF